MKNLTGMEIMNYGCEAAWKSGNSEVFFDQFWWKDNPLWCLGTDDGHDKQNMGYCGGYIVVKTDDFTHGGILDAISQGSFYAGSARMGEDSPKIIDFYTPQGHKPFHSTIEEPLTYAEYLLPKETKYVKAICVDFVGNTSWCQPIIL